MRVRLMIAAAAVGLLVAIGAGPAGAGQDPGSDGGETVEEPAEEVDFADHAAEECYDLLVEGGTVDDCQEAPNPILPERNEIIWGGLAFLVLFVVLWRFALPPIRNMVKQREDRIRDDLERAEQAKVEAEGVLEDYRRQLAEARTEASQIIEASREQAEEVRRELIAKAEADAAEVRQRAAEDARLAADRVMSELRSSVADLSIELAEKVVERNLDHDTQIALIESYINQVGSR
jgi:F-type H+-transporting ATPase subunit b